MAAYKKTLIVNAKASKQYKKKIKADKDAFKLTLKKLRASNLVRIKRYKKKQFATMLPDGVDVAKESSVASWKKKNQEIRSFIFKHKQQERKVLENESDTMRKTY